MYSNQQEVGLPLKIKDEGVTLIHNTNSIDFKGDGVDGSLDGMGGVEEEIPGGLPGVSWGGITGTLSDQTDLQNELNDKLDVSDFNLSTFDTDDIADTADNRFTNDTDITRLANTSGTNTGDQDLSGKEDVSNKSTDVVADGASDTKYPSVKSVKTYADSLVTGLLDYRGAYDASSNLFPSSGGSGVAGAVLKGDMWIISVAGTLGGTAVVVGDTIIANTDTPGQTSGNWNILSGNLSYVPENVANKVTSISGASTDTQYPSAKLLYDQLLLKLNANTVFPITFNINGVRTNGQLQADIVAGTYKSVRIPYGWTVVSVNLNSDLVGSIVIDVRKSASEYPTAGDSICASAKPTLSNASSYTDSTLTGWTPTGSAQEYVAVYVESSSGCKNIVLELVIKKS